MINENGNARFVQLEEELDLFSEIGISPVKKLTGILNSVRLALNELKKEVGAHHFTDLQEEIYFFKYIKPKFIACQIYALEKYKVESDIPIGDDTCIKIYYEQELKFIRRFFEKHKFLYQYYLLDGKELDRNYFRRGISQPDLVISESPYLDPEFSAPGEYLFAKFMAMEKLQNDLMNILYSPVDLVNNLKSPKAEKSLKWTSESINLVEIAYGIWLTGQVNHGNVTITEIIELLEETFQVKIGKPFRRWQEIAQRKMVSPTKYIDQVKLEILKRIADGNK